MKDRMRLRFRIDPEPTGDTLHLRWRARCAHGGSWLQFGITLDLESGICKVGRLLFNSHLLGTDLARMAPAESERDWNETTGPFRKRPGGSWKVLSLVLPSSEEIFLLGLNLRSGHGEIVLHREEYLRLATATLESAIGPSVFDHVEVDERASDASETRPPREPDSAASDDGPTTGGRPRSVPDGTIPVHASSLRSVHDGVARSGEWLPDFDDQFDLV